MTVIGLGLCVTPEAHLVLQGFGEWSAYTTCDLGVVGKQRGGIQPSQSGVSASVGEFSDPLAAAPAASRQQIGTGRLLKTTSRVYPCPTCGKTFNNSKDCRRHAVIHTGIKPFKCPYCPHRANLKFNLTKHIQVKHSNPVQ